MPHDPRLADRVRVVLGGRRGVSERNMFGGVCFMIDGNMCCGVEGDDLMLRLGEEGAAAALEEESTRPTDFTGRPMKSMVYVSPSGVRGDDELRSWVDRAVRFAAHAAAQGAEGLTGYAQGAAVGALSDRRHVRPPALRSPRR